MDLKKLPDIILVNNLLNCVINFRAVVTEGNGMTQDAVKIYDDIMEIIDEQRNRYE